MEALSELFTKSGLEVLSITDEHGKLVVSVKSGADAGVCPCCGRKSRLVHSHYLRTLRDLPAVGTPLVMRLTVRKFSCEHCRIRRGRRRIFDTMLRRVRAAPIPAASSAPVIGVDEWALRKGQTYGTIICDLERSCPIDLLPDRDRESLCVWLRNHPEVRLVSRDRSGALANGIREGAPQAIQVADRWHLLKNAQRVLRRIADRHHREIRQAAAKYRENHGADSAVEESASHQECHPLNSPHFSTANRNASRTRRLKLYQSVRRLHHQGLSQRDIAQRMGLHRSTVQRFIHSPEFPERATSRRSSTVDQHSEYLQKRLQAGCNNVAQLYRELQRSGFHRSYSALRRWAQSHRNGVSPPRRQSQFKRVRAPSSARTAWLLMSEPDTLTEDDRVFVAGLSKSCPSLRQAAQVLREFATIIRQQQRSRWTQWLVRAADTCLPAEIRRFAKSLKSDEAAIKAALKYRWSNGPVEGHINRLKTLKRQMYGRASFDLLGQRVLSSP